MNADKLKAMTLAKVGWEDILREVEDMYQSMTAEGSIHWPPASLGHSCKCIFEILNFLHIFCFQWSVCPVFWITRNLLSNMLLNSF